MASEVKPVSIIVALNGINLEGQVCRLTLIREDLWGIIAGTEACPD